MDPLLQILVDRRDEVMRVFEERVRLELAPEMSREDVLDKLPHFLDQLAEMLRREEVVGMTGEARGLAAEHGDQRLAIGFSIGDVIRDYAFVREAILEVAKRALIPLTERENHMLSTCLLRAIHMAAASYTVSRDAQLKRLTAEHYAFVAHELRTPLTSIRLAFAILARRGQLPDSPNVEAIRRGLDRLGEQIDGSLARLREVTAAEPRKEPLIVKELLDDVVKESALQAEEKGIRVIVEADPALWVDADRAMIHSAITNLLRNAIKFSGRDTRVTLRARHGARGLHFEVEDACGGLAPGAAETMFEPYVQLGSDRSGFGLGLTIARNAVEAHHGSLRVRNLPGKGCVMSFDLPDDAAGEEARTFRRSA